MVRVFFSFSLFCFLCTPVVSQISRPGTPPGIAGGHRVDDVVFETMATFDVSPLMAEDAVRDTRPGHPWRFGKNIPADLHPDNSGRWHELDGGARMWRLGIASPGAYALNLTFDDFYLPPGGEMYIYSPSHSFVLGAFTHANNQDDGYFATSLVPGDSLIIEYVEPPVAGYRTRLNVQTVTHAYRDPMRHLKAFGHSGWCNINVACDEALGWEDQVRSVVMLLVGSNAFCSGVLMNNTNNDGRPFLLSANHCYRNPSTVVAWFNWQSETCENPEQPPPYDALSGAVDRARHFASDVWLMELQQPVPESYTPYFAGWNRTGADSLHETITGIHHPRGDIKKFSYSEGGIHTSHYLGNPGSGTTHWHITWDGGTTTEPGSSGSPIFDSQGRVVGQLHGGYAACGNTLPDWYGRFNVSWTGGGEEDNSLHPWLDPVGLDAEAIPGLDPYADPVGAVADFLATSEGTDRIQLQWTPNGQGDLVMIAMSETGDFGHPMGYYSLGQQIHGGGEVVYLGHDESTTIDNLRPGTDYYFRAWSFIPAPRYSEGTDAEATTGCPPAVTLPYSEWVAEGRFPECWTQEYVDGDVSWGVVHAGDTPYGDVPAGEYSLVFGPGEESSGEASTLLITPVIETGTYDLGMLSFHAAIPPGERGGNTLTVLVREYGASEWTVLETVDEDTGGWKDLSVSIPASYDRFRIAFRGNIAPGGTVYLDNISVCGQYDTPFDVPCNLRVTGTGNDWISLEWDYPGSTRHDPLHRGFIVYRNGHAADTLKHTDARTYTDRGLPIGPYVYRVSALYSNPEWESEPSEEVLTQIEAGTVTHRLITDTVGPGYVSPPPGKYDFNTGATPVLKAVATGYSDFIHWDLGDGNLVDAPETELVMDSDRDVHALFARKELLVQLGSQPANTGIQKVNGKEGGGVFPYGTLATVETSVPGDRDFLYWSRDGQLVVSTRPTFVYEITREETLVAHFTRKLYGITAVAVPREGGLVSGTGVYEEYSEATLEALPASEYLFSFWEEDGEAVSEEAQYSFTVNRPRALEAHFALRQYEVSVSADPPRGGTTLPATGTQLFFSGDTVRLRAEPSEGWILAYWDLNGEVVPDGSPEFVIREDVTARAVFGRSEVVVYPNPASHTLFVEWPGEMQAQAIELFNSNGQRVRERRVQPDGDAYGHVLIDVRGLSQGMYVLVFSTPSERIRRRVLLY